MVRGDPVDQERTIAKAFEAGVNYFDTAVQYGDGASERNLGRVLKSLKAVGNARSDDAAAADHHTQRTAPVGRRPRARHCIGMKLTYHCGDGNPGRPQERRGARGPTGAEARAPIPVENNAETEALRFTPAHLEPTPAAHQGLRERLVVTI